MTKKVLITGGAGFIGSHLCDFLLQKNYHVNVIDNFSGGNKENIAHLQYNKKFSIWNEDIRDLKKGHAAFNNVRYVFRLAGIGDIVPSIEKPVDYISVNVIGTANVLECARYAEVEKLVYAASSSCYGLANTPTSENHDINPLYPYALSKYQGEQLTFHWHKVYDLPVNSICIFNAFGTRVKTSGAYGAVFGVFLKQKLSKKPLTIVGDGSQSRDFVYVTDVAEGFYKAATTCYVGQRYNLGAGKPKKIKYLAELIGGEIIHLPDRPGEPKCTYADIRKIQSQIGWEPKITFEDGVKRMLFDIDYWKDAPLWDVDKIDKATKVWFRYMKKKD